MKSANELEAINEVLAELERTKRKLLAHKANCRPSSKFSYPSSEWAAVQRACLDLKGTLSKITTATRGHGSFLYYNRG